MPTEELDKLKRLLESMPPGEERSSLESGLENIASLPPMEQEQAIKELTTAYDMREGNLRDDLTMAYDQYQTPTAEGDVSAPGNPYSVTIAANPLEHLAVGMERYQGGKGIKEARTEREKLAGLQEAGMQRHQAAILKQMEEEKKRRPGSFLPQWFTG